MTLRLSRCISCKHYTGHDTCRAFPQGIPYDISVESHLEPVPGQVGDYAFAPKDRADPPLPLPPKSGERVPVEMALERLVQAIKEQPPPPPPPPVLFKDWWRRLPVEAHMTLGRYEDFMEYVRGVMARRPVAITPPRRKDHR
jgi:hypothetical protein